MRNPKLGPVAAISKNLPLLRGLCGMGPLGLSLCRDTLRTRHPSIRLLRNRPFGGSAARNRLLGIHHPSKGVEGDVQTHPPGRSRLGAQTRSHLKSFTTLSLILLPGPREPPGVATVFLAGALGGPSVTTVFISVETRFNSGSRFSFPWPRERRPWGRFPFSSSRATRRGPRFIFRVRGRLAPQHGFCSRGDGRLGWRHDLNSPAWNRLGRRQG